MALDTSAFSTEPDAPDLFAEARANMVNSQIRPNKVNDPRLLAALRRIPREVFVAPSLRHLAYVDEDIPLGNGRFMMEPMVLARLLQAALLQPNEQVLTVGAGSGYGAAILDACGCRVTALEEDPQLIDHARSVLPAQAPGVTLVTGPLAAGWPAAAPYDVILIEGAVPEIPAALAGQLRQQTGRVVAVQSGQGRFAKAVIGEASAAGLRAFPLFDCGTPPLPAFRKAPAFEF